LQKPVERPNPKPARPKKLPRPSTRCFALGDIREKLEDRPGAITAFRKARAADRGDRHGAGLRLVRLGEAVGGEPMSPDYVRAVFDQYAPRLEGELIGGLGYRGPQLLRQAVETVAGAGIRFERSSISAAAPGSPPRRLRRCTAPRSASIALPR